MKHIFSIADVHGKNNWKAVLRRYKKGDTVVFLGDYFDSKTLDDTVISVEAQISNFNEICMFALEHREDVHLLLGNHDLPYIGCRKDWNDGTIADERINRAFLAWRELFSFTYEEKGAIFSHGGVTAAWKDTDDPHAYTYAYSKGLSPCWIRPKELVKDPKPCLFQVVGHTPTRHMVRHSNIYFTDTVGADPVQEWSKVIIMTRAAEYRSQFGLAESLRKAWKEFGY